MVTSCGFVGAGQMARALARGFTQAGLLQGAKVVAYDPWPEAARQFGGDIPAAELVSSNAAVLDAAELIFLAVKPQKFAEVAAELAGRRRPSHLFVSILAGVSLATLSAQLGTERVIRVMPNTPCLVGSGAAGYALGAGANAADGQRVGDLLRSVGVAIELEETHLDAVTGLSGSGPAYVYTIIEALSDGGVRMGLPRAAAAELAAQTVLGAARMVVSRGDHPAVLKDQVTSPGGTTICGLQALERHGLRAALIEAVQAATERSRELGRS